MRKLVLLSFCFVLIFFVYCKNESKVVNSEEVILNDEISKWPQIEGGFYIKKIKSNNTVKPIKDKYIYYDMIVSNNGTIIKNTFGSNLGCPKVKCSDIPSDQISPSLSALKTMSIGDSCTIVVRGEKYINQLKKQGYSTAKGDIIYQIVLHDIKSEEDYNKDIELLKKENIRRTGKEVKPVTVKTITVKTE